jgi:hypothetical protein
LLSSPDPSWNGRAAQPSGPGHPSKDAAGGHKGEFENRWDHRPTPLPARGIITSTIIEALRASFVIYRTVAVNDRAVQRPTIEANHQGATP